MATSKVKSEVLTKIYRRDGHVTASAVVAEATPAQSPIHDEFEWDDKKAAHEHRLSTARRMIRITTVTFAPGVRQKLINVPAIRIASPCGHVSGKEGVYKTASDVVKTPGEYKAAMAQLQLQIRAIEKTIAGLKQVAGHDLGLVDRFEEAMGIARDTLRLMLAQSA